MPEYLAPAVYVEETSFRPKPLEGASTSTTAFVGVTRRGPVSSQAELLTSAERDLLVPELITSVGDFERVYGSTSPIGGQVNYLAHAVRGFFGNGGRRLYVARVAQLTVDTAEARAVQVDAANASTWVTGNGAAPSARFVSRFPGSAGNGRVSVSQTRSPALQRSMERATAGTMVGARTDGSVATAASVTGTLAGPFTLVDGDTLTVTVNGAGTTIVFNAADFADITNATGAEVLALIGAAGIGGLAPLPAAAPLTFTTTATGNAATLAFAGPALAALGLTAGPFTGANATADTTVYFIKSGAAANAAWLDNTAAVTTLGTILGADAVDFIAFNVEAFDADGYGQFFEGLSASDLSPSFIGTVLGVVPPRRSAQQENLIGLELVGTPSAFALRAGLTANADANGRAVFVLGNGADGAEPSVERYREGLEALASIEGISIIAAPGSSAAAEAEGVRAELIANAEQRGAYRIAVLDAPPAHTVGQIRGVRATIDSDHAALYYPWVVVSNPDARPGDRTSAVELSVPPSGHICGIYARNDAERGVYKAPANEVVLGALRFESSITTGQQEVLNPEGINVLRSFRGRGHRVWGARLASSDPEFRYVNVRRYFNYVSSTLDVGTQWVVFEPNGTLLWDRVSATVSDFLYDEWTNGALLGRTQDEAFFVRCGRSTMTQNDIDNGRLVVEVGMALVYPAEFVIFRIGQKTATATA